LRSFPHWDLITRTGSGRSVLIDGISEIDLSFDPVVGKAIERRNRPGRKDLPPADRPSRITFRNGSPPEEYEKEQSR
jgi:hypothetical protein